MVTNEMIGLFFIVRLFCLILAKDNYYIVKDIEIFQLTLTTGANLTIKCIGWDDPITWDRNELLSTQKNFSIKLTNETYVQDVMYKSLLHLTNVSILDIGYYYCGPISANISENKEIFEKIYIFVQDDKYLLTNSVNNVYQNESGDVIIPCRPTSPNINVTIKKDNKLITENIHYDDKIGYTHWFFLQDTFQNVSCEANKNNFSEIKQFTIYKNPNATKIIISDGSLDHIYTGQNVTLECTVYTYPNKSFTIEWDFPDNLNKSGNVQVRTEKFSDFKHYKMGTKVLHIQNITVEDYGNFTCRVKFDYGGEKEMKYVPSKVISTESDYLDLKIVNGKQSIVCRPGSKVEWEIQAFSNQNVTFEWFKKDEYAFLPLEKNEDKYNVETRNNTSKLVIKNVETSNSGYYSLISNTNSKMKSEEIIIVDLAVEVEPSIQLTEYFNINIKRYEPYYFWFVEYSNLSTIYYEPNNVQSFYIKIIGNPLPKIQWFFQCFLRNCSKESSLNESVIIKDFVIISNIELRLIIGINVTENGTLILNASNYLGITTEKYEIVFTDLEIFPNTTEHFLRSDSPIENRTLVCKGNLPIQWHFKQYDETLIIKTNFSSKFLIKDGATQYYLSTLQLEKPNYLDTGYYYCSPLMADKKLITKNFKNIYVFVEDETHLFAFPSDINTLFFNSNYGRYVIPCRPTSQDVKVHLKSENDTEIHVENFYDSKVTYTKGEVFYDTKVGYIITNLESFAPLVYVGVATKNNKTEEFKFTNVSINVHIVQDGGYSSAVLEGQSLNINCKANMPTTFSLRWYITAKLKNKTSHYDQSKVFKYQGSISLSIPNVTVEDHSEVACIYYDYSYGMMISYKINIIKPDSPFLNLKILEGRNLTIRPAGFRVQWTVQISANPKPYYIEWRDQYGNNLTKFSKKIIIVQRENNICGLVINDIQLLDSGNYTLSVDNGNYTKEISVSLLVEDKPSFRPMNLFYSKVIYDIGKVADFEFYIFGYPLPEAVCKFQKCSNYPLCGIEYTQISVIKNKTINITNFSIKLSLSINITETGTLVCSAENIFGVSVEQYTIMATDIPEGFFINGPRTILTGATLILDCGVSIYNYHHRINWTLSDDISNHTKWNVSENNTQFSIHSYLMIQNISKKFNGHIINCTVEKKRNLTMGPKTETIPFLIKTEDPHNPNIISPNLNYIKSAGESVEFVCFVEGMPQPTISWSKVNGPLRLKENVYRIELQNKNQTLTIHWITSEDEGTYECNATNRFGSVVSTHTLIVDKPDYIHPIIYSVIFGQAIVILIGCVTFLIWTKISKKNISLDDMLNHENYSIKNWNSNLSVDKQANLLPYDKKWEFPIQNLKLGKQLGSGAFGIVFKGTAIGITNPNTTTTVAVKTIKPTTDPRVAEALISELKIMANLGCHLNIVNLLGACTGSINKKLMVIVEYCHFGCIHQYLLKRRNSFINQITADDSIDCDVQITSASSNFENNDNMTITYDANDNHSSQIILESYSDDREFEWSSEIQGDYKNIKTKPVCTCDLINWSFQISRGMDYLSSKNIIHGDLAARNILLSEGNIVKICDFGLAKNLYYNEKYEMKSKKNLPFKWMAIESIGDRVFSTKSDVWSFGIVLWEIFSLAATPYPSIQLDDLYDKLVDGYRMNQPKYANSEIYNVMSNCWIAEPSKRPSFSELAESLGNLLQTSNNVEYTELNENYVKMSKKKSLTSDIINSLTKSDYRKCSVLSKCHRNSQTNKHDSQNSLELQPMLQFAARDFNEAENN